jgi:hypothetical protein
MPRARKASSASRSSPRRIGRSDTWARRIATENQDGLATKDTKVGEHKIDFFVSFSSYLRDPRGCMSCDRRGSYARELALANHYARSWQEPANHGSFSVKRGHLRRLH